MMAGMAEEYMIPSRDLESPFVQAIINGAGIDIESVRKVTIVYEAGSFATVYIEMYFDGDIDKTFTDEYYLRIFKKGLIAIIKTSKSMNGALMVWTVRLRLKR